MQSGQESPQATGLSSEIPPQASNGKVPGAAEVTAQLKRGKSPMDFIRANSPQPQTPPPAQNGTYHVLPENVPRGTPNVPVPGQGVVEASNADTQAIIDKILAANTAEIVSAAPTPASASPASTPPPEPVVAPESPKTEPPIESDSPTFSPARANFKKLETALKAKDSTIKEKDLALEVANKKIKDYETGTATPEALQIAQNQIADLTRFKQLVDFKASPEYESEVIQPLTSIDKRLNEIAADYEIPLEALQDAMKSTKESDTNRFLSEHFDAIGGTEVKQLPKA